VNNTTHTATESAPGARGWRFNLLLIGLVVALAVVPLFLNQGSEFGGADGQAEGVIAEIDPAAAEPWFQPLWSPPGGETESLLFALQAALGAGFIGYYLGLKRGERKGVGRDRQ
jgi:cobalt/nickel transport protein